MHISRLGQAIRNKFTDQKKRRGLNCPVCLDQTQRVVFVDTCGPFVKEYQCKRCTLKFRVDSSPPGLFGDERTQVGQTGDPYRSFRKGLKFRPSFPTDPKRIVKWL